MSGALGSQDWVEAGFEALAEGGIDLVRVEVLAQRLGVTKGGFYRRYRDRPALLDAMLAVWVEGRMAAIQRQTELGDETPHERLVNIVRLFAARQNARGLSIELAVRQWARSDERAAAAVEKVDAVRLANVSALYARIGFDELEAKARGQLFYAYVFGQGLLFPATDAAAREATIAACAEILAGATPD